MKNSKLGVILSFLGIITLIILLSLFVTQSFGGHPEIASVPKSVSVGLDMTISEISATNNLKLDTVKDALKIKNMINMSKTLKELSISEKDANDMIIKKLNLEDAASKSVGLMVSKFLLWAIFMTIVFGLLRRGKITPTFRKYILLTSFIIFGGILGSEPNSMSTVTYIFSDYAIKGIIFPPRLVALSVYLLAVFLANKFFCAWACQFGTLQDLIFRLNRNSKDKKGVFKQYKVPFSVSNTIRGIFFLVFVLLTFIWSFDIIEIINPFNIFNPMYLL